MGNGGNASGKSHLFLEETTVITKSANIDGH